MSKFVGTILLLIAAITICIYVDLANPLYRIEVATVPIGHDMRKLYIPQQKHFTFWCSWNNNYSGSVKGFPTELEARDFIKNQNKPREFIDY